MTSERWTYHAGLLRELIWRELASRYRGSVLGFAWTLITPLLMLGVYAWVFGEILRVRWTAGNTADAGEFALILFAGLLVFNFFAECTTKAPALMTGNVNYIKKVVFPVQLICLANVVAAAFQMLMAVAVLAVFELALLWKLPLTLLLFPVTVLPLILFVLGLSWFLASIGAYLRDIQQVVGIVVNGLIFLTPVFYPPEMIPEKWRFLLDLNPMTIPINQARDVLIFGNLPSISAYLAALFAGALVAGAGYAWFARTRAGLADVL